MSSFFWQERNHRGELTLGGRTESIHSNTGCACLDTATFGALVSRHTKSGYSQNSAVLTFRPQAGRARRPTEILSRSYSPRPAQTELAGQVTPWNLQGKRWEARTNPNRVGTNPKTSLGGRIQPPPPPPWTHPKLHIRSPPPPPKHTPPKDRVLCGAIAN